MKILVTGTSKGLGASLVDALNADRFDRKTSIDTLIEKSYDLIIHCAFNTKNIVPQPQLKSYVEDNIFLTRDLITRVKSDRFVFISSVDVYPEDSEKIENIPIDINKIKNIYGQCKLMCEEIVKSHSNYLILRCGGIIGKNKIPRSISSILSNYTTTLTATSTVNYVSHKIIKEIIETNSISNETINVVSDTSLIMNEFNNIIITPTYIQFGNYQYNMKNINTEKLKTLFLNIKIPSSKDTLLEALCSG
jgi:nucleoside-diphosphate-sugar epimerase